MESSYKEKVINYFNSKRGVLLQVKLIWAPGVDKVADEEAIYKEIWQALNAEVVPESTIHGKRITLDEALEGLGDPNTWDELKFKIQKEMNTPRGGIIRPKCECGGDIVTKGKGILRQVCGTCGKSYHERRIG